MTALPPCPKFKSEQTYEDGDIDCSIDGIGPMGLKSEFVKKV